MAVTTVTAGSYLSTGGLVSTASDFTLFGWLQSTTTATGSDFQTGVVLFAGGTTFAVPYIWFGTFLDGSDLVVQLETDIPNAPECAISAGSCLWFAVTYNA